MSRGNAVGRVVYENKLLAIIIRSAEEKECIDYISLAL